ncbi:MAG: nitroreductase family protein [Candidatus Aenigmatarchaeota archaeon]
MPLSRLPKLGGKRNRIALGAKKATVFDVVMENIMTRRSVRKFRKLDVGDDDLMSLFDAARHAPSAGNRQAWEFIIVRDPKMKKTLSEAAEGSEWIANAPVIVVACVNNRIAGARYGERGTMLYGIQDVACALENFMLAANAKGLGTCWVGAFSEPKVTVPLRCPDFVRPCAMIAVGWPDEAPSAPLRHEAADFLHLETYGNTVRKQFTWGHGQAQD